jgi:hypothetical protein
MRRPGERYIVTSQAVPMPIRKLRAPTPAISPSVRRKASATKEMRNAAADQARLPLSLRRANRPCKVAPLPGVLGGFAPSSAPFSAIVAASLAPVDHQGGNRLER